MGDLAILANPSKNHLKNEEVEIIEGERERQVIDSDRMMLAYRIKVVKTGEIFMATGAQLKALDPPETPSNWKNCPWQPYGREDDE